MLMTKEELYSWLNKTDVIQVSMQRQYDECGNSWDQRVYKCQNKYYVISFDNGEPSRAWDGGKLVRDQQGKNLHEIVEVSQKTRTVEQIYYCDERGHDVYIENYDG